MNGPSYLISMILLPLVISGALCGLVGWFLARARTGSGSSDRALQQSKKALETLTTENEELRNKLEMALRSPQANDDNSAELEALRLQNQEQKTAARALSAEVESLQGRLSGAQADWQVEREGLALQISSLQGQLSAQPPTAGSNQDLEEENERLLRQIEGLREQLNSAEGINLSDELRVARNELADLREEHERMERELIQARNSGPKGDDEEKATLKAQLEKVQRELIAMSMAAEDEPETGEVIALRAMNRDFETEVAELRQRLAERESDIERALAEATTFRIAAEEVPGLRAKLEENPYAAEVEQLRADLESTRNAAASQVQSLKAERDQLQAAVANSRQTQSEVEALRHDRDRATADREQARAERDRHLQDRMEISKQRDELQQELGEVRRELELARSHAEPVEDLSELKARFAAMEVAMAGFEAERAALTQRLEKAQSMAVEQTTIIANLETELANRVPAAAESADPGLRVEFEAQIAALERALGTVHIEKIRLEDELSALKSAPAPVAKPAQEVIAEEPPPLPTALEEVVETSVEAEPVTEEPAPAILESEAFDEEPIFVEDEADEPLFIDDLEIFDVVQSDPETAPADAIRKVAEELAPPVEEVKKKRVAPPKIAVEGPDDLEEIIGIGPVARRTLVERGIDSYEKIANLSPNQIDVLSSQIENFRERLVREKWREQAKVLFRLKYGREI